MTLNQLLTLIKDTCEGHAQVNNYHFGNVWEYLQQDKKMRHCSVLCEMRSSRFTTAQIICSFSIYVMDWVGKKENTSETEVLSDTLSICRDIHAILKDPTLDIDTDDTPSATPFVEAFEDLLAGWRMDIDIAIDFEIDRCAVPED